MNENNRIPNDPVMLLSYLNLKLRDYYSDLHKLCEDLQIDYEKTIEKMRGIDYEYDENTNQFI